MARGISVLLTALVAGAVGFGAGVYVGPTKEAEKFRAFVDEKISSLKKAAKPGDKNKAGPTESESGATPEALKEPEPDAAAPAQTMGDAPPPASTGEESPTVALPAEPVAPSAAPEQQQAVTPSAAPETAAPTTVAEPAPIAPPNVGGVAAPVAASTDAVAPPPPVKKKPKPKPKPKPAAPVAEPPAAQPE